MLFQISDLIEYLTIKITKTKTYQKSCFVSGKSKTQSVQRKFCFFFLGSNLQLSHNSLVFFFFLILCCWFCETLLQRIQMGLFRLWRGWLKTVEFSWGNLPSFERLLAVAFDSYHNHHRSFFYLNWVSLKIVMWSSQICLLVGWTKVHFVTSRTSALNFALSLLFDIRIIWYPISQYSPMYFCMKWFEIKLVELYIGSWFFMDPCMFPYLL